MKLIYGITQRGVWIFTFIITRLFTNFYINGKDNLKSLKTPLLIIANHRSYWDPMIIGTLFPFFLISYLPIGFMAADKLYGNFWYKIFFKITGTFPTYKGMGLDISLKYPRSVLNRKGVFLIFPFGKIILNNQYLHSNRGAAKLVQDFSNLTILPVYLNTTPNLKVKDVLFGRKYMRVTVGKPFMISTVHTMNLDQISKILSDKIISLDNLII